VIKVAMIGAGSVVFSRNLTGDILSHPEFRGATLSYMDVDPERLAAGAALCRKVATALGANPTIETTTDLRQALRGADFVINMVQIGGFDSTLIDFEIPRKYGLRFTIADTTGPGGMFRALRTFPFLRRLCRAIEELCPRALLLNYANPMGMNMQTVCRTSSVRAVGLCHSVQSTFDQLMQYLGEDPTSVNFVCAGINHMAFYLRLEKAGIDLYPRLFDAMSRPEVYSNNKVRFELLRRLGYFVTESSEHNAEYNPWFIPHGREVSGRYNVPLDEYLRRCDANAGNFERLRALSRTDEPIDVHRSSEYGSTILHSMATGRPSVVYGNMPNRGGTIANLPPDAIVEAPTPVDRDGPRFAPVGDLPPQLVGYVQPHVAQHELFIRAATEGRRDHVFHAAMLDPLTAAVLTPDRIVEMCDELIAGHGFEREGGVLPDLDARRTLVPASEQTFGRINAEQLRAGWQRRVRERETGHLVDWHVIGPFPADHLPRAGLELPTAIERALSERPDGSIDLAGSCRVGDRVLRWQPATAGPRGFVDLGRAIGAREWSVAYGYAEFDAPDDRAALLRCGSDDGIKVWLNGQLVHHFESGRAYVAAGDEVVVHLRRGTNRLLLKVDNYTGGWGFGVAIGAEDEG
jgi:alpha-galactosidase